MSNSRSMGPNAVTGIVPIHFGIAGIKPAGW